MFELYRPASAADPSSPYVVYPSSLFCLGLGYALWHPEPHETTGEPQIGDVGYVKEGALIRLLNINASRPEHQVTSWKKPFENTDPLADSEDVFHLDKRHSAISDGRHLSRGVRERETRGSISVAASAEAAAVLSAGYTCKETQGALLVLQSDGYSETVFSSRELQKYMIRQHEQWCNYLRDVLKQVINPEDVFLVSGWAKTSADWAVAAFSNLVSKHYTSVEGQAGRFAGFSFFRSRTRAQSGPKMHRQGSKYPRDEGRTLTELEKDQSIFLLRYKLKRRFLMLKTIVAGAGYDRLPDHGRGNNAGGGLSPLDMIQDVDDEDADEDGLRWLQNKVVDPLDILLEYIFEVSDAEVAIARDDDIHGIIGLEDWPIDFATYLRRIQPPVQVEDHCGTISIPDLLAREHVQRLERRFVTSADLRRWPQISYDGAGTPSMAPAKLTDDPELSPDLPTKWPYIEFNGEPPASDRAALFITFCATSPDGQLLASVTTTIQIIVWRLSDGLSVQRLGDHGHEKAIRSLAFSPDGRFIASGSADATGIIWNIETGLAVLHLKGHRDAVEKVAYTADGLRIITASQDSSVKFWDAESGAPLCNFPIGEEIQGLVLSPEGSRLAVWMKRSVTLYDVEPGKPIVQLGSLEPPHSAKVLTVAFTPGANHVFISDSDGSGRIFSTDSCKQLTELERLPSKIVSAAFSPDGNHLATVALHHSLIFWNPRSGALRSQRDIGLSGAAVAFSPNGKFIAAAGGDEGHVRVWTEESEEFIADFTVPGSQVHEIRFLSDSRQLLTFSKEGPVCLWNIANVLRVR